MGIKYYLILIILIISAISDIKYREVSNVASLFILIISVFKCNPINIVAIFTAPLPLILTNIYHKDNFGGADIKILASLGLYLGITKSAILVVIATSIELIVKIIIKKQSQPFIPYILLAYILVNIV